ncbi:MAG: sigma 54-interacting transcriptional regulator [Polyangiaceae bacterium]|nr:sigma 54-interacting transcriptional regulator [Polyangiaceae bacterium]
MSDNLTTTQDVRREDSATRAKALPFLFVILQCDQPTAGGSRHGLSGIDVVTMGRGAARAVSRVDAQKLDLRLPSSTVSKAHARLIRREEGWFLEDLDSRNGCCVNGERVTSALVRDGDSIEIGSVMLRYRAALPALPECAPDLDSARCDRAIPGYSSLVPAIGTNLDALARVARAPITTLLLGETGTGKELLAKGMHAISGRPGPFVAVNCGALTSSLVESQLFGHLKGSFTGARRDEPGYVRSAERGTLFLDEIGDLPFPAQAALLRVLQEREVVPVGGTRPSAVDVRIIAATNKSLDELCLLGEFRADLLARLKGYQHMLSPLRERMEDIGVLIGDLLQRTNVEGAKRVRLSVSAARRLVSYSWPQNIRELDNALSVAAALADRGVIEVAHLPEVIAKSVERQVAPLDVPANPDELREQIVRLLEEHRGNVTTVARKLGKSRMQVHRWLQRFGIEPDAYRG